MNVNLRSKFRSGLCLTFYGNYDPTWEKTEFPIPHRKNEILTKNKTDSNINLFKKYTNKAKTKCV